MNLPLVKEDHRYIMTVFLVRAGRAKYWEFHCPFCTQKVCEVDGSIFHMRDVSHNTENEPPILVRCPGTNRNYCRFWYGFQFSS